mgnify:CR=1 FL=1
MIELLEVGDGAAEPGRSRSDGRGVHEEQEVGEKPAHPSIVAALAQGCANGADRDDMKTTKPKKPRSFLGIMFDCCSVYNRVYINRAGTAYEGRCPRCRRSVRFVVGSGGSDKRMWRVS